MTKYKCDLGVLENHKSSSLSPAHALTVFHLIVHIVRDCSRKPLDASSLESLSIVLESCELLTCCGSLEVKDYFSFVPFLKDCHKDMDTFRFQQSLGVPRGCIVQAPVDLSPLWLSACIIMAVLFFSLEDSF